MLQREREWNVADRLNPTCARSRDGAYVMLRLKAENPNQPLSSVEKGCGDCEPINVRVAKLSVNGKFARPCTALAPVFRANDGTPFGGIRAARGGREPVAPGEAGDNAAAKLVISR